MDEILFKGPSKRRFFPASKRDLGESEDEYGFLNANGLAESIGIEELFGFRAAWITARPWFGKTYVAKCLEEYLRSEAADTGQESPFGRFGIATFLNRVGKGFDIKPSWWDEWKVLDQRACWVVDAIDEDWSRGRAVFSILQFLEALPPDVRARLTLLMFCRENEQPGGVLQSLRQLYPPIAGDGGLVELTLAPPDHDEAIRIAGDESKLETAKQVLLQSSMQSLGALPTVLKVAARYSPSSRLTERDLWRAVLDDLLRGGARERDAHIDLPPLLDRFEATARAGAVMAFAGLQELDAGFGLSSCPPIDVLYSNDAPRAECLRKAARLAQGIVMVKSAHGYRFADQHVQECFAAFALEYVPLNRLRPLLGKDDRPWAHLRGIMSMLSKITRHETVRDWITEIHGGFSPQTDVIPWTLQNARVRLDRLQELARRSPFVLSRWDEAGLENLEAPGLGTELVKRLQQPGLEPMEKILLLEVARAVEARAVAPVMERMIRDAAEDGRVREGASYYLRVLGSSSHFANLKDFVRHTRPSTREQRVTVSNVIRGLLDHSLWSFRDAYAFAPAGNLGWVDASSSLEYELKKRMTMEDARWLLADFDWEATSGPKIRHDPSLRLHHANHGPLSFALHAAEMILKETVMEPGDYALLQRIVLARDDGYTFYHIAENAAEAIGRDRQARRTLFTTGLQADPERKGNSNWRWLRVLQCDDAKWLMDLSQVNGQKSPWLWQEVLRLAAGLDRHGEMKIRERVQTLQPQVVEASEKSLQEYAKWCENFERMRAEQIQQRETRIWQLADLVDSVLNDQSISS